MTRRTISLPYVLAAQIDDAAERTTGGNVSTWVARAAEEKLFREQLAGMRYEPLPPDEESTLRELFEWQQAAAGEGPDRQAA